MHQPRSRAPLIRPTALEQGHPARSSRTCVGDSLDLETGWSDAQSSTVTLPVVADTERPSRRSASTVTWRTQEFSTSSAMASQACCSSSGLARSYSDSQRKFSTPTSPNRPELLTGTTRPRPSAASIAKVRGTSIVTVAPSIAVDDPFGAAVHLAGLPVQPESLVRRREPVHTQRSDPAETCSDVQ